MIETEIRRPDVSDEFLTPERCWILESWNSSEDTAVSIARARVTAGVTTQLHRLRDTDERYIVIEGQGDVRVGDDRTSTIGHGDIVVIPRNVPQQIQNTGDTDLVFFCICSPRFTPDCYESLESPDITSR